MVHTVEEQIEAALITYYELQIEMICKLSIFLMKCSEILRYQTSANSIFKKRKVNLGARDI